MFKMVLSLRVSMYVEKKAREEGNIFQPKDIFKNSFRELEIRIFLISRRSNDIVSMAIFFASIPDSVTETSCTFPSWP